MILALKIVAAALWLPIYFLLFTYGFILFGLPVCAAYGFGWIERKDYVRLMKFWD